MQFIKPVAINDAALVSSTRPEDDFAAWSGAVTYAANASVVRGHRVFESAQAGNLGHDPLLDDGATWWVNVGPTNRWAMFDQTVGSVTSVSGAALSVVLRPGIVSALALLDLVGSAVRVQMSSDGNAVYDRTFSLADDAPLLDYWMYFFDPITPSTALVVTDLPPFHAGDLTVTIEPAGDIAACGTLAVGELVAVGRVQYGARIGLTDYSRKTTDEWGVTAVVERGYAKRFEPSVLIPASAMDYVARRFAEIRATPVIWVGVAQYESTVIYGWLRDWGINITYPTYVQASVTIEGLS